MAPLRLCLWYFRFVSRIVASSSCTWSSGHVADIETDMSAMCPRGAWRQAMWVAEARFGLRLGIASRHIDFVCNQAAFFKQPGQVTPCGPFRNLGSASQRCRVEQLIATKHGLNDAFNRQGVSRRMSDAGFGAVVGAADVPGSFTSVLNMSPSSITGSSPL